MTKRRFPRKAKKWAKKNGVLLIAVTGKQMWYAVTGSNFHVGFAEVSRY